MKTVKILSLCLLAGFFFIIGCKKETTTSSNTTQTRTEILTAKDWQIDEVYRNVNGINTHYVRNGLNTTGTNYQNNRIHFNANGTGTYKDDQGNSFPMTWIFSTADQRTISIDVSGYVTYTWNMVELKDNYLHCTSIGTNSMNTARYIQIP